MLRIVGDINLTDGYFDTGFGVGSKLSLGFNPFNHLVRNDGDLWIGNFEGVAADVSNKRGTAAHQFRVSPKYLNHLRHFDIYGCANNHAMQHGKEAYAQTVATLEEQGARCFGMNNRRSVIFEHQDQKISITGFSQRIDSWKEFPAYWHNPEYEEIVREIEQLPKEAFKIVYVHWGNEFINYPSSSQKKFAHWLIDVGFDLIVGMHPHILQGYEVYKGKYIFYSIGNFVFDMAWEPTHYGAIVKVDFKEGKTIISFDYIKIGTDYAPCYIAKDDIPEQYRFDILNRFVSKEENSEEYHEVIKRYYQQYRKANHKDIMMKMLAHPRMIGGTLKDFIKRRLI